MEDANNAVEFPCSYPLKVIGRNDPAFFAVVSAIVEKHVGQGKEIAYSTRASSGDKYLAVTATFIAESRDQLTAIYKDLRGHDLVVMTL